MTQSQRKFVGVILTLALVIGWAIVSTALYLTFPPELHPLLLILYFAVAGLGWAVPAGMLIKWMARPDR